MLVIFFFNFFLLMNQAEDDSRTKHWYNQLQYHAQGIINISCSYSYNRVFISYSNIRIIFNSQGTGAWRKRRTGLANIMINGMMLRQ